MNDLMYYGRLARTGLVDIHEGGQVKSEGTMLCVTVEVCIRILACKHAVWNIKLVCNNMCYVQLSIYSTIYYTCWLAVMHELHSSIMGGLVLELFMKLMQYKNAESSLN